MDPVQSSDLDFIEKWALSDDRKAVLSELVPGSNRWYYFQELLSEQSGYPADLEGAIEAFLASREADRDVPGDAKRFKWRRALSKFSSEDEVTAGDKALIKDLVEHFRLSFSHRQDLPAHADDREDTTPTSLDLSKLSPRQLLQGLGVDSKARSQLDSAGRPPLEDVTVWQYLNEDPRRGPLLRWLLAGHGVPRHLSSAERVAAVEMVLAARTEDKYVDENGVSSRLGQSRHMSSSLGAPLFRDLTLAELRMLRERGKVPVWKNQAYLKALVSRVASVESVDFDMDVGAKQAYLDAVLAELAPLKLPGFMLPLLHAVYYHRVKLAEVTTGRLTGGLPGPAPAGYPGLETVLSAEQGSGGILSRMVGRGSRGISLPTASAAVYGSLDFFHFLSLPRQSASWNSDFRRTVQDAECSGLLVRPGQGASAGWLYGLAAPSSGADTTTVQRGIQELLGSLSLSAALPKGLTTFVTDRDLSRWRAEALLLAGKGGSDTSLVTAVGGEGALQRLRDRVDLELAPHNKQVYDVTDPVSLHVYLKNVSSLTISVFEINTTAFYKEKGVEISTSIDLDGLIPNDTRSVTLDTPPIQRGLHTFPIEALSNPVTARRGVFVVELVGGGYSARAIIRKGALRFVTRETAAGQAFRVLDETNSPLPNPADVSLWIGGRTYTPREDGEIMVPFAQQDRPGQSVIMTLKQGDGPEPWSFSSLSSFTHYAEHYQLEAAWYVEEEGLVKDHRKASVALRARLRHQPSGAAAPLPLPLSLLEDVRVTVESTDGDGVSSSKDFKGVQLSEGSETTLTIAVPNGLRKLTATLHGTMTAAITGAKQHLTASHTTIVNGIDGTDRMKSVYLRYVAGGSTDGGAATGPGAAPSAGAGGWRLYVLGKSGEALPGVHLRVSMANSLLGTHTKVLRTGADGFASLGDLHSLGFDSITVADESSVGERFPQASFDLVPPGTSMSAFFTELTMVEGSSEPLVVPFHAPAGTSGTPFALVRMTPSPLAACLDWSQPWSYYHPALGGMAVAADAREHATHDPAGRCITLAGMPAGAYQLTLFRDFAAPEHIVVHVLDAATAQAVTSGAVMDAGAASGAGLAAHTPAAASATAASIVRRSGIAFARSTSQPVRVTDVSVTPDGKVVVATAGGSGGKAAVRVHLAATHFAPYSPLMNGLGELGHEDRAIGGSSGEGALSSQYIKPRLLGEEHRYILDRAQAAAQAGNTLPRPSLLLNPWAIGKTQTDTQEAAAGSAYDSFTAGGRADVPRSRKAKMEKKPGRYGKGGRVGHHGPPSSQVTLDFLAHPARQHFNLTPDAQGCVSVPLAELATDATGPVFLTVVATDAVSCAGYTTSLMPSPDAHAAAQSGDAAALAAADAAAKWARPMSLEYPLPPTQHFSQQKSISVLRTGESASITAASDTKVEEYATLSRILRLFTGLSTHMPGGSSTHSAALTKDFSWLVSWPSLSPAEKAAKYSKYACHEVHLFLYMRDRAFFDSVVRPYLQCKRAKTFMDRFVLGEDLTYYAAPGPFAQLNHAERALLIGRLPSAGSPAAAGDDTPSARAEAVEAADGAAHAFLLATSALDRAEQQPTPSEVWELVFNSAISSNALEDDDKAHALADKIKKTALRDKASKELERAESSLRPQAEQMFFRAQKAKSATSEEGARLGLNRRMQEAKFSSRAASSSDEDCSEVEEEEDEDDDEDGCLPLSSLRGEITSSACEVADLADRRRVAQEAYRSLDKTEEFAEMHYWNVKTTQNTTHLVTFSEFWADFAMHRAKYGEPFLPDGSANAAYVPFVSRNFALAARSLNEMLLALAVIELPFTNDDASDVQVSEGKVVYTAKSAPVVLFHKDLQEASEPEATTVLVGQNYFDPLDRYKTVKGQQVDKYVAGGEFMRHKVYGVQCVITNVSSASQELDYLLQIPQGAVPLRNGFVMKSFHQRLSAYSTTRAEYFFYFPALGEYAHYPVHVSADEELVAAARPTAVKVVDKPTFEDHESWQYVSQQGSEAQVMAYLCSHSLAGVDVGKVAWRCSDPSTWHAITSALAARGVYNGTIWQYAFKHGDVRGIRQWLLQQSNGGRLGSFVFPTLASSLVSFAPEPWVSGQPGAAEMYMDPHSSTGAYEHLEYSPLVNARAHQLGASRKIMNVQQSKQWRRLLEVLAYTPSDRITTSARLAIVYHLLLQDRVMDAQAQFAKVPVPPGSVVSGARGTPGTVAATLTGAALEGQWGVLMYDYLAAYLDFFNVDDQPVARAVAAAYAEYPVPKWQRKFAAVAAQLAEADGAGGAGAAAAGEDSTLHADAAEDKELAREKQTSALMSSAPSLDIMAEGSGVRVTYSNLSAVSLRFYLMDIELLFSTSAFVTADSGGSSGSVGQFAFVRPNDVVGHELPAPVAAGVESETVIPLPDKYSSRNVLVEAVGAGIHCTAPYFANSMRVHVVENAGRVSVRDSASGRPLPKVYVKVFSRRSAGDSKGKFYKDGYTDLRGVFDYASLSTDELSHVQRFALLVKSQGMGAVIRTARPPAGTGNA